VSLSLNGGVSWSAIATRVPGATCNWVVPGLSTLNALVRVTLFDAAGSLGSDTSDQPFAITSDPTAADPPVADGRRRLLQNVPNPLRSATETRIGYGLPGPGTVRLAIYDAGGHLTRVVVDVWMPAGAHEAIWDGRDHHGRPVPAGVYFYELRAEDVRLTRRMVVLR